MKKLVIVAVVAACAAETFAMPTRAELTKAQPLVAELMAPAMAKYKSAGYKEKAAAAAKVGDASSEFAKAAETEAAKFLLLKGAVNFYTRGEQYDKAADTIAELQREVKDVPPAVIAEITGKATSRISEAKAPRLYAVYRTAKLQVRAADEAKALKAKLKKVKSDVLQRKYAEALAISGDWKAAYAEFAKVGSDGIKAFIAKEVAGDATDAESGEFWWAYEPALEEADDFFKALAAAFYRRAIDAGEISGLKKTIIEQRIEKVRAWGGAMGGIPIAGEGTYCIIDLSGGPDAKSYPVKYRNTVPKGGWTDEYKTTKLVLRKIEPGSFEYMPGKKMTITKPFHIGIFEVTQKQYALVCGSCPEGHKGDTRPVVALSYEMIRGKDKGLGWPNSSEVDEDSFVGMLRVKSGMNFDLPTEAQWEYACRAGTTSKYNDGTNEKESMEKLGRCFGYGGVYNGPAAVGTFKPNAWGLYEMHGNVFECCLDRSSHGDCDMFKWSERNASETIDPIGPANETDRHIMRGGSSLIKPENCTSGMRFSIKSSRNTWWCRDWDWNSYSCIGCRLAIQPSDEKKAKHSASSAAATTTAAATEVEKETDTSDDGREVTVVKTGEEGGAAWRYSFGVSNGNWAKPGFDDSGWQQGKGMFVDGGYLMTDPRFTRVVRNKQTKWESDHIWLRQSFGFDGKSWQNIGKVTLRYFAWGAAEFYLNGEKVAVNSGGGDIHEVYNRGYVEVDITAQAKKLLKLGKGNVLAAHASNNSGGRSYWIRYIDAGLSITIK